MRRKQWGILGAIVLLAVLAFYQSTSANKEEIPKAGYKAPSFSLTGLDGKTYSLDALKGKPVVINFWASWCGPCKIEAPELVKLYAKYKGQVELYAVNVTQSDSIEGARAFAQQYGFRFPVLLDEKAEVSARYQIQPIPTSFFVDKDGTIKEVLLGLADPVELENKFKRLIR